MLRRRKIFNKVGGPEVLSIHALQVLPAGLLLAQHGLSRTRSGQDPRCRPDSGEHLQPKHRDTGVMVTRHSELPALPLKTPTPPSLHPKGNNIKKKNLFVFKHDS